MSLNVIYPGLLILLGFALMILGADRLIAGASQLAFKFKLPKIFVGTVLVAFGTSAPELVTSLFSASIGEGTLSAGNAIGSNVFNSTLVMGVCLLFPFALSTSEKKPINYLLIILPPAMFLFFAQDFLLTVTEGLLLLLPLPLFFYLLLTTEGSEEELEDARPSPFYLDLLWLLLGIGFLYLGSTLSVENSLLLAEELQISKAFAGSIILALGTSLPELATTVIAGLKKEISLALGNIIGSNALNIWAVLGASSVIYPIKMETLTVSQSGAFMMLSACFLVPVLLVRSAVFHKIWALLLFALYAFFVIKH